MVMKIVNKMKKPLAISLRRKSLNYSTAGEEPEPLLAPPVEQNPNQMAFTFPSIQDDWRKFIENLRADLHAVKVR